MEKNMESAIMGFIGTTTMMGYIGTTTKMGYIGATIRIHSFILSEPKVSIVIYTFELDHQGSLKTGCLALNPEPYTRG